MTSSIPGCEAFRADDLLGVDEVADIMGVNAATVGRWRMKHTGPAYQRLSRSLVVYRFGAVAAWYERLSERHSHSATQEKFRIGLLSVRNGRFLIKP